MKTKEGADWEPAAEDLEQWRETFPDLKVDAEISKMRAWLDANPGKRKTERGMKRFIVSWLTRANDRGGSPIMAREEASEVEGPFGAFEKDEIHHKLTEVMAFYGKEVDRLSFKIWLQTLFGWSVPEIKAALDEYLLAGKFAPKPADLIEILRERRARERVVRTAPEHQEIRESNCPPEIAMAWSWFIRLVASTGKNPSLSGAMPVRDLDPETEERYLHIVNHEAKEQGMPEAIPEQFRLMEVWG